MKKDIYSKNDKWMKKGVSEGRIKQKDVKMFVSGKNFIEGKEKKGFMRWFSSKKVWHSPLMA